jgi:predicted nuclease of predicted toxin-antitoxin system
VKLKLDENISRHLAPDLAALGHDVQSAWSEGLLSQPDDVIFEAAKREGRMLFTLDLDLANIKKYPPGSHPGIVLFRPKSKGALSVAGFVREFARSADLSAFARCLAVVDEDRIRVRRPD